MIIGIMQPYFFPYLGYYQLASKVDHFLFYDDAKMIKKGFIQRNSILINGEPHRFTIPIKNLSQNRSINEHYFLENNKKFLKLISENYRKHPFFKNCYPLIEKVIKSSNNVSECCENSIKEIFKYINKDLSTSRTSKHPSDLKSQERIIDICKKNNATHYCNPIGGKSLYSHTDFKKEKINLIYHYPNIQSYTHYGIKNRFIEKLSIIDIMMNLPKENLSKMIIESSLSNE